MCMVQGSAQRIPKDRASRFGDCGCASRAKLFRFTENGHCILYSVLGVYYDSSPQQKSALAQRREPEMGVLRCRSSSESDSASTLPFQITIALTTRWRLPVCYRFRFRRPHNLKNDRENAREAVLFASSRTCSRDSFVSGFSYYP